MPRVLSEKNTFLHCNHTGCTVPLEAGIVTEVDSMFMRDALTKNLTIITGDGEPTPVAKMSVQSALEQIIMKGKPSDFNSLTKVPKVKAVSDLVGSKVSNDTIRDAWDAMDMPVEEVVVDDSE